jgi:aminopeptidase N
MIGTPYPYAKYAQIAVADFIYGGMENTSATTQTDAALLDSRAAIDYSSDELVAHELAHQWFGDLLTCKHWSHAWLNESFATYFDALFKRFDKGDDEYRYAIRNNANIYFSEDKERYRRSIVTKMFRRPTDIFDRHLYEKGSVVIYMLHHLLGEDLFWKSIQTYVRKNRAGVVETTDFINAIEEATGRNMRRFFDQWVYGAGHPEFRIRTWWDSRKSRVAVRLVQTHAQNDETGLFSVPAELALLNRKGEKRHTVEISGKSHLFHLPSDGEPTLILFDPDHRLLSKNDFPKSEAMWMTQLIKDKNPLGRIDAANALAKIASPKSIQALRQALLTDDFWGVRAEVAQALGSIKTEEASHILLQALDVIQHPKIRRALYAALRGFNSQTTVREIEKRFRNEASYFAEAEGLRGIGSMNHPQAHQILQEALKKDSWNDTLRIAALEGLAATRSREWIPLMISSTKPGNHQRLRMAAIRCLATYGPGQDEIQERLITLLHDSYVLVQVAAARALAEVGDERAVPALKLCTTGDLDGRLKRLAEEAIGKITKGFD